MPQPIDHVVERAKELGFKCKRFASKRAHDGLHRRYLLIQGRKCQVISAPVYRDPAGREALSVHLSTSHWPDFFIYVSTGRGPSLFFIVPRGMVANHTSVCSVESWIFKFHDAWSLLTERLAPAELERRFRPLNWKMEAIIAAAKKNTCAVELIPKKDRWPFRKQNKLFINGRRCQVMSAHRLSTNSSSNFFNVINVRKPHDDWAEFVFYLVRETDNKTSIFIMPSEDAPARTTTTVTGWLDAYRDAWSLVNGTVDDALEQARILRLLRSTRMRPKSWRSQRPKSQRSRSEVSIKKFDLFRELELTQAVVERKTPQRQQQSERPTIPVALPRNVTAASLIDEQMTLLNHAVNWRKRADGDE